MKTALVVDDVKVNQMLIGSFLKKSFEVIDYADNGLRAYEQCKENKYDLILMDVQMPLINGLDATELIRKKTNSLNKNSLIIGITASSKVNFELKCLDQGMNSVLFRPVTKSLLLDEIKKFQDIKIEDDYKFSDETKTNSSNDTFDFEKALFEFAGEKELLLTAIDGFIVKLHKDISDLKREFNDSNYDEIRRISHRIRGAALNLTANSIADIATQIEEGNDILDKEVIHHFLFLLEEKATDFIDQTQQFLVKR